MQKKERDEASTKAEEEFRQRLLAGDGMEITSTSDLGPSLKKKQRIESADSEAKQKSLISSMDVVVTPPHEFSKSLGLSNSGLTGKVFTS